MHMNTGPADNRPPPAASLTRSRVTRGLLSPTVTCMPASWPVEEFRDYLRALMTGAGIADYAELSRLSGVSQTQFSNWRHGISQPSRAALKKIAPLLHVPPVLLYLQAGLDNSRDLDLSEAPDLTVWPREFHNLHAVYERFAAAGRGAEVLDAIATLTLGLDARIGKARAVRRRTG